MDKTFRKVMLLFTFVFFFAAGINTAQSSSPDIVNGSTAAKGMFPYMASLRISGYNICGASIIDRNWVLTAAHCVQDYLSVYMSAVVGSVTLEPPGQTHEAEKYIMHQDYRRGYLTSDIALVQLKTPIQYNELVQPIKLESEYMDEEGDDVILSGWGTLEYWGKIPNDLQYSTFKTINVTDCQRRHNDTSIAARVSGKHICTLPSKGFGACSGDSGSPLVRVDTGEQTGITSWTRPCALGFPDVYTRVATYIEWIQQTMANSSVQSEA